MTVLCQLEKNHFFFSNGPAASSASAKFLILNKKKTNFLIFYIKILNKYATAFKNIEFLKRAEFWKK